MTLAKLKAAQVPGSAGRVLDLTLAGTRYEVMKSVLDIMLEAPEFDMVVAVVGSSARFQPDLAVKPIMDSAGHAKPLVTMLVPDAPQALAALTQAGMPCFRTPESCADAMRPCWPAVCRTHRARPAAAPGMGAALSEAQAYQLLDRLQVPHAPAATFALDGQPGQLPFDFPVVAKVCSPEIPHKTEVGGVVLGIQNPEQLVQAFATLRANLAARAPGVACNEVLVQPLRKGLTEVLLLPHRPRRRSHRHAGRRRHLGRGDA
jgi:acyl-CoA synthetase (NDP forming)